MLLGCLLCQDAASINLSLGESRTCKQGPANREQGVTDMTLLYYSSFFLEHNTGNHPENADRLCATVNRLEKSGLARRCTEGRCAPLDEEGLARIHDAGLVIAVRDLAEQGGGGIGP